jgi:hypothetical protein
MYRGLLRYDNTTSPKTTDENDSDDVDDQANTNAQGDNNNENID